MCNLDANAAVISTAPTLAVTPTDPSSKTAAVALPHNTFS
jgi:hypothetical protein